MSDKRDLTRAESARQRRAQRAAQELTQTSKRATTPIVQPVTKRVVTKQKPMFAQVERKRQRRFQIALGLPDSQFRRPQFGLQTRPSGKWRFTSLGLVVALTLVIYFALVHPYFNIPSVTVLGNGRLTREDISAATGVVGQSIFTVQPADVEMQLRIAYPELLSVKAEVYLPNHLYVTVTERQPVILWQHNESYTWVDEGGVAFRPNGTVDGLIPVLGLGNPPLGIPPADAPFAPPPFAERELVEAIRFLAPNVPSDTVMVYDPAYGLGWQDARGWQVFFGATAHDMALKVRVYQSLSQSLLERGLSPVFISIVHPDAPYYRMAAEVEYKPVKATSGQ